MGWHAWLFRPGIHGGGGLRSRSMDGTAVEDHPIDTALQQAAIEGALSFAFGKKLFVANFHTLAESARQDIEKSPQIL